MQKTSELVKMTQNLNIAQELTELQSSLAGIAAGNTYSVPEGYFEGLAEQVLRRIRAMEATTAAEELGHLSPVLSTLSKKMPYQLPAGYFDEMNQSLSNAVLHAEKEPADELAAVSPLLSGLKKEMPFSTPAGYFEQSIAVPVSPEEQSGKLVSMGIRNWFRYAAAAVVTGVVALSVIQFSGNSGSAVDPNQDAHAWMKKNTEKIKTENIEELLQLTTPADELSPKDAIASADQGFKSARELVQDIPEEEIRDFLKETEVLNEIITIDASDETINR